MWEGINRGRAAPIWPAEPVVAWAVSELAPGSRVLDVGAGAGRHARALRLAGHQVRAIDPWPGSEDVERGGLELLRTIKPQSFDAVLCWQVLPYVPESGQGDWWFAMRRVLVPGGKLLASVRSDTDGRIRGLVPALDRAAPDLMFYGLNALRFVLVWTGFDVEHIGRHLVERPDRVDDDWIVRARRRA